MSEPTKSHRCLNCGSPLTGPFCAQCGQSAREVNVPFRKLLGEFLGETLALDSRLWHTVKPLILKPGLVAREYNSGRRAYFVPPIRLYLFTSFVLFLIIVLSPSSILVTQTDSEDSISAGNTTLQIDTTEVDDARGSTPSEPPDSARGENFRERRIGQIGEALSNPETLADVFAQRLSQVMFFLVPLFGLLLKIVYRKQLFVQHMVFALYFHVFAFLLTTVVIIPAIVGLQVLSDALGVLQLWIPIYLFLGLRRLHGESRWRTAAKSGFILLSYIILLLAGMLAAFVLAVLP